MIQQAPCEICAGEINRFEGFLLTTTQLVSSSSFWQDRYQRYRDALAAEGVTSFQELLEGPALQAFVKPIASKGEPWLVCEKCIHLFKVDRGLARTYARRWWESGRSFRPPGVGPVPLAQVSLAEVARQVPPFPPAVAMPQGENVAPAPTGQVVESVPSAEINKAQAVSAPWAIPTRYTIAPKTKISKPPRGVPRSPLVVALLNLGGLGLGYLYLKRPWAWLFHFLVAAGLVAAGFLKNAAAWETIFLSLLGLWLIWMALHGAWFALSQRNRSDDPGMRLALPC